MALVVVQQGRNYENVVDYLVNELNAQKIQLPGLRFSISGKLALILSAVSDGLNLLRSSTKIKRSDDLIVFSHFSAIVKLFSKLGLIRYRRLYCYGFFIHSPRWFFIFRLIAKIDTDRDNYIVFTKEEIELYSKHLSMNGKNIHYLPYGDWGSHHAQNNLETKISIPDRDYYFSGGYSNRDYASIISVFRQLPIRLIIVCSRLNKDIPDRSLPENIIVLRDLPGEEFDAYVRQAKACIVPLKHDTGASGQSTLLRYMRSRKAVIASDMSGVRPYVEDRVSGYLIRDISRELPQVIAQIEANSGLAVALGQAGYERYVAHFSRTAVSNSLKRLLHDGSSG